MNAEFKQFLSKNSITHIISAPYHPSSNGLAERAMQSVKQGIKNVHEGNLRRFPGFCLHTGILHMQITTRQSPQTLIIMYKRNFYTKVWSKNCSIHNDYKERKLNDIM